MQRSARKNRRLQERLEAIQREMSRVEGDIRVVEHAVEHPDREKALRRLKQFSVEQDRPREVSAEGRGGVTSDRHVARGELTEKVTLAPGGVGQGSSGRESGEAGNEPVIPKSVADQRFANYFVTGGLHSVKPLRQEQRVLRNRAILMAIIAAAVLYGVISMLF